MRVGAIGVTRPQWQVLSALSRHGKAAAKLATGSQVPGVLPAIAAAQAQHEAAVLNLRQTEVRAPLTGRVSQAERLLIGQQVVSGPPVVTIVAKGASYVEANFKETDLAHMRVGQPAEVALDAYPGVKLKAMWHGSAPAPAASFRCFPRRTRRATGSR